MWPQAASAHQKARRCPSASAPFWTALLKSPACTNRLEAAVEQVFVNVNPASTLLLGQARGAALSALVLANLPIAEYTALQVKQSVVGNGHAGKEQVQAMVVRLLKLNGTPQADAADALAVALCHANHSQGALSARLRRGRLG